MNDELNIKKLRRIFCFGLFVIIVGTALGADAKQYNTQAAANADCATLNNTYGAGRFIVGSHPKPH